MPTGKLNKRTIEALRPDKKDFLLWDEDTRGFGVKVTPAGGKIYLVQYRMGGRGTALRRYTIGRHGTWTPATARIEAERVLRLVQTGTDPMNVVQEKERLNLDLAFPSYALRFLEEHGKRNWRQSTYVSAESNMRRWVIPPLARKSMPAITRRDLITMFDGLPSDSPALPRNIFALVRKMFGWATERGDIDRSPFDQMRSPAAVASRDRVLTNDELKLVTACTGNLGKPFDALVLLLVITGQRLGEVSKLTWSELDRPNREWRIPAERTKNARPHTVPLSDAAIAELDRTAEGDVWPRKGLVFTTTGTTAVSGYSRAKRRLDGLIAEHHGNPISPWRLHDLRRTFATNMQRLGVRFEVTEALLNHVSGSRSGVAGVYQRHDWADEKRQAMDLWADKLRDIVGEDNEDAHSPSGKRSPSGPDSLG